MRKEYGKMDMRMIMGVAISGICALLGTMPQPGTNVVPKVIVTPAQVSHQLAALPKPGPGVEMLTKMAEQTVELAQSTVGMQELVASTLQMTKDALQNTDKTAQEAKLVAQEVEGRVTTFLTSYQAPAADAPTRAEFDALAAQLAELQAGQAALDARCQCGKTAAPAVAAPVGGGSTGSYKAAAPGGGSTGTYAPVAGGGSTGSYGTTTTVARDRVLGPDTVRTTTTVAGPEAAAVAGAWAAAGQPVYMDGGTFAPQCYRDASGQLICPQTGMPVGNSFQSYAPAAGNVRTSGPFRGLFRNR